MNKIIFSLLLILGSSHTRSVFAESDRQSQTALLAEIRALIDSSEPLQQQEGFLKLEAQRDPGVLVWLRDYLGDSSSDRRAYAVRALAAIDGLKSVDTLLHHLDHDDDARVRRAALLGLEPFSSEDERILPAWISRLKDSSTEVRMSAVDAISRIDKPEAHEAIRERYKNERRSDVRRVLEVAITRIPESLSR